MTITLTTTAYSATPRAIEKGNFSVSFDYTSAAGTTLCASANASVILGPKIQNQTWILGISGSHSSGADSCPVDIGIDASLSEFSSQKTQGSNAIATKTVFPFKVSLSDDAVIQYRTLVFGVTPGTNTAVANLKYTVTLTRDI